MDMDIQLDRRALLQNWIHEDILMPTLSFFLLKDLLQLLLYRV